MVKFHCATFCLFSLSSAYKSFLFLIFFVKIFVFDFLCAFFKNVNFKNVIFLFLFRFSLFFLLIRGKVIYFLRRKLEHRWFLRNCCQIVLSNPTLSQIQAILFRQFLYEWIYVGNNNLVKFLIVDISVNIWTLERLVVLNFEV